MEEVEAYVLKRQNTAAQYIAMQLIINFCEDSLRWPWTRVSKRWWEQEGLDLVGVWEEAAAALEGEPEFAAVKVGGGYWVTNTVELCST